VGGANQEARAEDGVRRSESGFRERIVVGRVRPAVGFGDAEIGEQERRGLGPHGTATVGVQGQLAGRRGMLGRGILEQCRKRGGAFFVSDAPADDPVAEDAGMVLGHHQADGAGHSKTRSISPRPATKR
jgi:hypothetical protein